MKYIMELKDLTMKGNFPMCTVMLIDENGNEKITGYVTP